MTMSFLEGWARAALRIVAGFMFACHGMQKLFGFFGGMAGAGAKAHFISLPWIAGVLEFFGGILIIAGLFAVPVAFVLSGEMAVGYFMFHFPRAFWPIKNGGELAVLYCFFYLYLAASGPGRLSLDKLIRKK